MMAQCWYDGTLMLTTDGVSKVQPGIPVADETDAPKPLTGGGAVTARTDVEIEGQEADQSDHSSKDNHQGESQQPATNFSFQNAEKMEITAVEDNVQDETDDSEADSSGSEDLVKRMRDKYKESSGRDSSSSSSSSSEEEYEAKSSSSSKSTHTSNKVVSSQKEVDDADADTADDVSDIETDVEWPRKSEEEINAGLKQRVNDALPPKPQKPSKKIQGILSPKKQKNNGQKKRTSFKMDDEEDEKSDVNVVVNRDKEDDGSGKEKIKKKRRSNISKEKNYEIGIVAYEEGVEQEKEEPLGLRASDAADRKKDDDQTSDIPEISVNKSGVTLFSDRVDDVEPCQEHVTVGYEEEMDERGTESDVEGEGKSVEVGGGDRGTSGSETSEDMVAQYAARLTELDERAGTEDSQGLSHKVLNHAETSHHDGSRENMTTELHDVKGSHPAAGNGQEVGSSADLPKILIDSSEASGQISQERRLSEAKDDPRNMLTSEEEQYNNVEVTLADINAKNPGGVPRRVSVGGESLLSVPCSGVVEKDCVVWTGGSNANQEQPEDEVISPRQCDTKRRPSLDSTRDDDMQQQIPIILVEGGSHPSQDKVLSQDEMKTRLARTQSPDSNDGSPGRTLSPERIPDTRQYKLPSSQDKQYRTPPVLTRHDRIMSSDTESERNSSAEAAAGSVPDRTLTSEDTGLYTECNHHTENKPSVGLMREESQSLPTIITEHVD
ncbi:otolith matrix protein OMM-64-like [Haliotis cracherodii]|uniref:otolith matrix protein OMM-64-like n=1 Tax=Haliotis cracherodii TaxID=6455 RepID=UPI0039E91049